MERYIVINRQNGYCGCDEEEFLIFPENATNKEIEQYIQEGMCDYADEYLYLISDDNILTEEDMELYYSECSFNWRDATETEIEDEEFTYA